MIVGELAVSTDLKESLDPCVYLLCIAESSAVSCKFSRSRSSARSSDALMCLLMSSLCSLSCDSRFENARFQFSASFSVIFSFSSRLCLDSWKDFMSLYQSVEVKPFSRRALISEYGGSHQPRKLNPINRSVVVTDNYEPEIIGSGITAVTDDIHGDMVNVEDQADQQQETPRSHTAENEIFESKESIESKTEYD